MTKINFPSTILFDFDSTLAYLYKHNPHSLVTLNGMVLNYFSNFINVPDKYFFGKKDGYITWYELCRITNKTLKNSEKIIHDSEKLINNFEFIITENAELINDAIVLLNFLKSINIKIGIVSNNSHEVITKFLQAHKIDFFFTTIKGRPQPFSVELIKPNPFMIDSALKDLKVSSKNNIWYVGDSVKDMEAAKNINITAIGVFTGKHSKKQLFSAGADICFKDLNQLKKFLVKLKN